jgi:hypothetical protein
MTPTIPLFQFIQTLSVGKLLFFPIDSYFSLIKKSFSIYYKFADSLYKEQLIKKKQIEVNYFQLNERPYNELFVKMVGEKNQSIR